MYIREEAAFRITARPELKEPVLIVGWIDDASKIGERTLDYIIEKTGCKACAEILPEGFFPMAGVNVEGDVALFPECRFFAGTERNLLVFKSSIPRTDWYRFLHALLDVSNNFGVKEIYTVGAMVSAAAHTMPRVLVGIVNAGEAKNGLEPYNVMTGSDFDTPPGQKPTFSSYLSWVARQRDITAVNLWVPAPFYLVQAEDPRACKRLVYFFNDKYGLGVDFTALDDEIASQNRKIAELFAASPEDESFVRRLETGEGLDSEQTEKLASDMSEHFKKK
jgi:predicted ATP-grasp superfamily ATP-dependent carboligase